MEAYQLFASMRTLVTIAATIVLVKYFIYLVVAPWYGVKKALTKKRIDHTYNPKVSVIIPAWNEEVGVFTSINSVLASTYKNIEIIVVNDGSDDNTHALMLSFLDKFKKKASTKTIKYIRQPKAGKGVALNTGVKRATGELVVTMDADSAHRKDAIENLVGYFSDSTVDAVVGNVKIKNNPGLIGLLQTLEYAFGFYFKRVHSVFNAEYIFGGACAAFRKSTTFDQIGSFDTENKTEDIEYSMRVKISGLKSIYADDVVTYTEGASDFQGLLNQRIRWKKGRFDTFGKYRSLFFSRDKNHSKFLSWIVLPYAVYGEFQMFLEPMFVSLIASYTLITGDYLSAGLSSLFILFTFIAALFLGDREQNPLYILLFPAMWLLFYILVLVEYLALLKTIELIRQKKDVKWQSWSRKGVAVEIKS